MASGLGSTPRCTEYPHLAVWRAQRQREQHMETIFTAFYVFFCITNKEDPMPLLVWVGYWPSVPEYAPGQRSAVEYSNSISMYQRRAAAAHQPVPATSLHSPAVVCGDQWSEAHTIHSPAPRCAPNITYSRSIAQCVVWRCNLISS